MKTKELIRRLQKADPSGEIECCVGNEDIYFITEEPSYYDGALQVLNHDETLRDKAWSINGAKLVRNGSKIQIHTISIEDVIYDMVDDDHDFSVTIEGDSTDNYYQKVVEKWKLAAKKLNKKSNKTYE